MSLQDLMPSQPHVASKGDAAGFEAWMQAELRAVEFALEAWVPVDAPAGLGEAMRYGVLDGG